MTIRVWKAGLVAVILALCPVLAAAQLNETCTVSALNRTAPVRADGVWVLPNVPGPLQDLRELFETKRP